MVESIQRRRRYQVLSLNDNIYSGGDDIRSLVLMTIAVLPLTKASSPCRLGATDSNDFWLSLQITSSPFDTALCYLSAPDKFSPIVVEIIPNLSGSL